MARIKVRAKFWGENKFGYYGDKRRKAGDVFFIDDEKHFSKKWMEKIVDGEPISPAKKPNQITGDPKTRQPVIDASAPSGDNPDSEPSSSEDAGADGAAAGQDVNKEVI